MGDAEALTASPEVIDQLVDEIQGSWPQVMAVWEAFRERFKFHLRADVGIIDNRGFLAEALGAAIAKRRLRQLAMLLDERGLLLEGFEALAEPFYEKGFQLQRYVGGVWQAQYAQGTLRKALETCGCVCSISIDGKHRGTGVLIRPTVVVTAAHVIEPLIDAGGQVAGSLQRLSLCFTDPDDDTDPPPPIPAKLRSKWLGHYSPTADADVAVAVDSIDGLHDNGPWDRALIQLMEPPRKGLMGPRLYENPPPAPEFGIHILHHPAGPGDKAMPLLWSLGQMTKALGDPTLRWLHTANTNGGSSGAPCFDNSWRVVGLHQGGGADLNKTDQINRAVPIHGWLADLDKLVVDEDDTLYLKEVVDQNEETRPVLGRRQIQRHLRQAMTDTALALRATIVRGPASSGKTFTRFILKAIAQQAGQRIVVFDMQNAQADNGEAFAKRLLGGLGAELAPTTLETAGLTSALRDLRNALVPSLLAELEKVAAGTPLWLFLDGFEQANLQASSEVLQVVETMLTSLATAPNLRLVLTGWQGVTQPQTGGADRYFIEDLPVGPSQDDVVDHIWLSSTPGDTPLPQALEPIFQSTTSALLPQGADYPQAVTAALTIRASLAPIVKLALEKAEQP
jgi:hypothetical protein